MFARVPASSANLGPGFDALAVALNLYVEVSVDPADEFEISSEGFGAGLFDDKNHMAAKIAAETLGHWNFKIHVRSGIPLSRGLGSSAALAAAAAAAAGHESPLHVATEIDGHAENAAASVLGGLVVASVANGEIIARPLALDPVWRFVCVVPDEELATADARRVLPGQVPFADAVHNLNAMGLLIAGLADHELFVPSAMNDYLHQPYRMDLIPYARELLTLLRDSGAAGSCWSGAGSTMLGLVTNDTEHEVRSDAEGFLAERGIGGVVHVLEADRVGLVVR
jgi:homoserine kinase